MKSNTLYLIGILFTLIACSSREVKKLSDEDDDFAWITNDDFISEKEVVYSDQSDKYPDIYKTDDSLGHESLARFPAYKLEKVDDSDGPITELAKLCYRHSFEDASKLEDKMYGKYKNHPGYWNQVGTCYFLQGHLQRALLFYNKSKSIKADYTPAINNLGVLYMAKGEDQKALAAFIKALETAPFSLTPQFNLSQIYLNYGLVEKASKSLTVLMNANKRDADVLSSMATLLLLKGDVDKSILYFRNIEDKYLSRIEVGANYAVALKMVGDSSGAQDIFSKIDSSKLNGKKEDYYYQVQSFLRN